MKFNGIDFDTYFKSYPDANGFFGKYGGSYIPPELQKAMDEINTADQTICKSRRFISELRRIRKEFQGRPTPISYLERLSGKLGNVQMYVKREDLNHTSAHKLNHCMEDHLLFEKALPEALMPDDPDDIQVSAKQVTIKLRRNASAKQTSPMVSDF